MREIHFVVILFNLFFYLSMSYYSLFNKYAICSNILLVLINSIGMIRKRSKFTYFPIICLLYALIASFFNKSSLGAIVAYVMIFSIIILESHVWLSSRYIKILFYICIGISVYYAMVSHDYVNRWLKNVHGIINPNSVSMLLLYCFIFIVFSLNYFNVLKQKNRKIIIFFMWLFEFVLVHLYKCRTIQISLLFFLVSYFFIPERLWRKEIFVRLFFSIIFWGGCIFPLIYISLFKNEFLAQIILKMIGKAVFTGRELIWARFFNDILGNLGALFIGYGSPMEFRFGHGLSMHNTYLAIWLNFGLIGCLIFYLFLQICIDEMFKFTVSGARRTLFIGYLTFMINCYCEVILQTPQSMLWVNMLLGFACNESLEKFENSEKLKDVLKICKNEK